VEEVDLQIYFCGMQEKNQNEANWPKRGELPQVVESKEANDYGNGVAQEAFSSEVVNDEAAYRKQSIKVRLNDFQSWSGKV
jgi:hypothetical protein